MAITLEDCVIQPEQMTANFWMIQFSLPNIIDLYGIKERIDNFQAGHERFENKFGTLYVACDFCVRYRPLERELRDYCNGFEFVSRYDWPRFKGNGFIVSPPRG